MKFARRLALVLAASACAALAPGFATTANAQPAAGDSHSSEEIVIAVGETRTLSSKDVEQYTPANEAVAAVTPGKNEFLITGKKAGNASLLLVKKDGTQVTWSIIVTAKPIKEVERDVQATVDGMSGVRVRRNGGRFIIEGGVTSDGDLKRIDRLVQTYPGQVDSTVVAGPQATGDRKILVRLDFFFVEYDRSSSYSVGLNWPQRIGGLANNTNVVTDSVNFDLISKTTTSATASIVNQPLPSLDIGAAHGWAKILKQSTVISTNGAEATFNSGGEQNFIQTVGISATLAKIPFGTNVTVLSRYDQAKGDIEVKLAAEVSDLVPSAGGTSLPGRSITKLDTLVNLRLGQALVLSGIRTQTERHQVSGLVGLSSIPFLGILFGNHANNSEDIDGAVFIIPSLIETVPRSSLEVIHDVLTEFEGYSGGINSVRTFNKTPPSAK